jgi:uncharacterized coiled-coil protein SlyX
MTEPTYAEATARKLAEQERELARLRSVVAEQEHLIRGQQLVIAGVRETITGQQLRIQRLQLGIAETIDGLRDGLRSGKLDRET